jgi:uncharacterized sulfatase
MAATPPDRPNILLVTTDQQRWDALSLWGTPGYRTPHIDRLGREGARFDWSYCPSPVCTPARVSMITGQYSTRHGAYTIGMSPVPALEGRTLGSLLGEAGYATGLIGKTHFVARQIEDQHVAGAPLDGPCPPSEFWATYDGPYCGFEFLRHHRHHNAASTPNAHYRVWLAGQGLDLDELHAAPGRKLPPGRWEGMKPEWTQNAWITEETLGFVDRAESAGRPWMAMANYQDPHYPMVCPEPYFSQVDMTGVDLGGPVEGDMAGKPPFYQRFMDGHHWTDDDQTHFWDGICVPDTKRYDHYGDPAPAIQAYIGMCTMVDDYVGKLLAGLESRGLLDNTLVVFTSDHGDMLGRHGMWGKGVPAYDDQQRVPGLMMWRAAQPGPIGPSPSHFSHVDILPTCLDAAGVPLPPFVQGISQLPVLTGQAQSVRDWALIDHLATVNLHQQTLVTAGWKLVCYRHADYGELYDLTADPDQRENLWDREPTRRAELLLKLARANMTKAGTMPERIGPC